ncbi:MAG: hypothetical protein R2801_04580 [Chitinophagales bacterium]
MFQVANYDGYPITGEVIFGDESRAWGSTAFDATSYFPGANNVPVEFSAGTLAVGEYTY